VHATHELAVVCLQLNSTDNIEENLNSISDILQAQIESDTQLIVLPENAVLITNDKKLQHQSAQKETYQTIFSFFSKLAMQYQTWVVAGSLLIQDETNAGKYFNHCPVFSPDGKLQQSYNKMHLFDVDLGSESWQESSYITAGSAPETVRINKHWKAGLSICYDLRFPELYRTYSQQGCNIMTVPAAFTVPTGKAHWQTLLKARAIENQAFVLAAGQTGRHQDQRTTYGHSMIIDPWGNVLSQLGEGQGLIHAKLSLQQQKDIQKRIPALQHRRL